MLEAKYVVKYNQSSEEKCPEIGFRVEFSWASPDPTPGYLINVEKRGGQRNQFVFFHKMGRGRDNRIVNISVESSVLSEFNNDGREDNGGWRLPYESHHTLSRRNVWTQRIAAAHHECHIFDEGLGLLRHRHSLFCDVGLPRGYAGQLVADTQLRFVNPILSSSKPSKNEGSARSHDGGDNLDNWHYYAKRGAVVLCLLGSVVALCSPYYLVPLCNYRSRFVRRGGLGQLMYIGGLSVAGLGALLLGLWK